MSQRPPERLLAALRDPRDHAAPLTLAEDGQSLLNPANGNRYPVSHGVPSLMEGRPMPAWEMEEVQKIGDALFKRATGELPEKESSQSFARLLKAQGIYQPGDTILDVGCTAGHFLRSFRRLLDPAVRYTGIDTHLPFLERGADHWGLDDRCAFLHCDALNIPVADDTFDITVANLYQSFRDIRGALAEAMRVTRRTLLWRTPVGQKANYMVKVVHDQTFAQAGVLEPNRDDLNFTVYMLYTPDYIRGLVESLGGRVTLVQRDSDFAAFDNTTVPGHENLPSTKIINGMQINGCLVLDWTYFVIDCGGVGRTAP